MYMLRVMCLNRVKNALFEHLKFIQIQNSKYERQRREAVKEYETRKCSAKYFHLFICI